MAIGPSNDEMFPSITENQKIQTIAVSAPLQFEKYSERLGGISVGIRRE
ncbi:hypothetical protein N9L79_02175 [Alphaproteobacteria bacterium]|jgi:hypothetical protein|nr:hypothetical protein [Alphaproteobacteria bacterium]